MRPSEEVRRHQEREIEDMMTQLEWMAAGWDGRHAGLFWLPILCHDYRSES